jgi:hypothetical protein
LLSLLINGNVLVLKPFAGKLSMSSNAGKAGTMVREKRRKENSLCATTY